MGTRPPHTPGAYRIELTPRFERDFRKLDPSVAIRIIKKIERLAAQSGVGTAALQNPPSDLAGIHKFRVGDYRILLWVDHSLQTITLYTVAHRKEVYREF